MTAPAQKLAAPVARHCPEDSLSLAPKPSRLKISDRIITTKSLLVELFVKELAPTIESRAWSGR